MEDRVERTLIFLGSMLQIFSAALTTTAKEVAASPSVH